MGIGYGKGENRAEEAARAAVESPLLETSIDGAKGVLVNITGNSSLSLFDINTINTIIQDRVALEDEFYIFGAVIDENLKDEIKVTVVATGFDSKTKAAEPFPPLTSFGAKREAQENKDEAEKAPTFEAPPTPVSDELDIPNFLDSLSNKRKF